MYDQNFDEMFKTGPAGNSSQLGVTAVGKLMRTFQSPWFWLFLTWC